MKEWCREHITERNNWFVTQSGKKIEIQDDWKFCPICGTPRPEKEKTLAEKLCKTRHDWHNEHDLKGFDETLAQCALQHFIDLVDELAKTSFKKVVDKHTTLYLMAKDTDLVRDTVKDAMRKSVGGGE